jgi:SAM-dependent methyltransferase
MPGSTDSPQSHGWHLYAEGADLYDSLFGECDPEEVAFFARLLANAPNKSILSLGCGTGRLEAALLGRGFQATGVDASVAMLARALRRDPRGRYIAATMEAMPANLPGEPFGAVIAGTLSFAYLTSHETAMRVLRDCAARMAAGAFIALDIPVDHEPRRLQGTSETIKAAGLHYRFMWYDVIEEDSNRAVIDTDIWISSDSRAAARRAQLVAYRPQGIRRLLEENGFSDVQFHAPHDITTATTEPPLDCRRAVVVGRKRD